MPEKLPPLPSGYKSVEKGLPPLPEGFTPVPAPPEVRATTPEDMRREIMSKTLGTVLPENREPGWDVQAGMIAATLIPGFGQLGVLGKMGTVAFGGGGGSIYEDIKNNLLGRGPKKTPEQIALRAGISASLGAASEGVPWVAGKVAGPVRSVLIGGKIEPEIKDVVSYAQEKGFEVNASDYRKGLFGGVKQFHQSSMFGTASGYKHRTRHLAKLSEVLDNTLDDVIRSPGEVKGGKIFHRGLERGKQAFEAFESGRFEATLSAAGEGPVRIGPKWLAETSVLAKTIDDLDKAIPGIDPQSRAVKGLLDIVRGATGKKGAISETAAQDMLNKVLNNVKDFPDDPVAVQSLEMAQELIDPASGKIKEITPRVAHRLQSVLGQMAWHTKSPALKRVTLEAQTMVRDSMVETLGPDLGKQYLDDIAFSAKGKDLYLGKFITSLHEKNPEALVNSVTFGGPGQAGDFSDFLLIKRALTDYGGGKQAYNLFKRQFLEKEIRFSGKVTEGEAAIAPMEDLLAGIKNTGDAMRSRGNKEIVEILFDTPEDKAAIDGIKKLAAKIRLEEVPITPPRATHYGMYYALHIAALAGGGILFQSGHPIGGATLGIASVALTPALLTRIMYTPAAQRILLQTMDDLYARRASGKVPLGTQIDALVRAFVLGATKGETPGI